MVDATLFTTVVSIQAFIIVVMGIGLLVVTARAGSVTEVINDDYSEPDMGEVLESFSGFISSQAGDQTYQYKSGFADGFDKAVEFFTPLPLYMTSAPDSERVANLKASFAQHVADAEAAGNGKD